jgi:hemoglobin-like flavoprotein
MSPEQKSQIKFTWKIMEPNADQVVDTLYDKLFEIDPSLRILFKNDLGEQKRKWMQSLGFVIANLSSPATLIPVIRHFGRRHALYGAQPAFFATAKEAFTFTLAKTLGELYTSDIRMAWNELLEFLMSHMLAAAREASQDARAAA